MTTFSAVVDKVVIAMSRVELRPKIVENLNVTVREMHYSSTRNGTRAIRYAESMKEAVFTPASLPATWPIPKPALFMAIEAAFDTGGGFWYQERLPRTTGRLERDYQAQGVFYRSGPNVCFDGAGIGRNINMAWYEFAPSLQYKTPATRVVQELEQGVYTKFGGGVLTDAELEAEVHWLLDRHPEVLYYGTLTKTYAGISDMDRAQKAYSTYETLKAGVQDQEATG